MAYRQPSKRRPERPAALANPGIATPGSLEAHSFKIGSDEYILLSFPVGAEAPWLDGLDRLTASERDVVARVLRGQSNAAIASVRGTSPRTIANQLAAIYAKLGVRSRRELGAKRDFAGRAT